MATVPLFVKFLNKWGTTVFMIAMTIVGHAMIAFGGTNITVALIGWCVACIGSGSAMTMFFAMVGDTVDYGEWKTGIRANGFLTAMGASFCIQMGSGIGSFMTAKVLSVFGFTAANAVQSTESLSAIKFTFIWLPVVIYAISMVCMVIYQKWERHESVVIEELAEKHTLSK